MKLYFLSDEFGKFYSKYLGNIPEHQGAFGYVEGDVNEDINLYYSLENVLTLRPNNSIVVDKTNLIADGVDKITFTGALIGSTITVKGLIPGNTAIGTCTNPDYFSTVIPDTYTVTISLWPYLDFITTVTAE